MAKRMKLGIVDSGIDREGKPYTIEKLSSRCFHLKTPTFSYCTSTFEDARKYV